MFLNFIKEEYGRQSTSKDRKPIENKTFREIYKDVYQHRKDWK